MAFKKIVFFGRKKSLVFLVPLGAYRFSGLLRAAGDRFYDKTIDFFMRKIQNAGISSETTIRGISSETTIPGISSEKSEKSKSAFVSPAETQAGDASWRLLRQGGARKVVWPRRLASLAWV